VELLGGQTLAGLDTALQTFFAKHDEFPPGSLSKGGGPHCKQQLVSGA
jgi:hypothetical protein